MENTQIIKGLERRMAEIEVWISDYEKRAEVVKTDLLHLRCTIALFRGEKGSSQTPHTASVARLFKRGELYERCIKLLSASPEMDTTELTKACMIAKDMDPSDKGLRQAMQQQVIQVLTIHLPEGRIVKAGKRAQKLVWKLV